MAKRILLLLLLFFLLLDLGYSFQQHLAQPLDGDMAWNLLPAAEVEPILESPFGLRALFGDEPYANPNRFFCHWTFREYLTQTPPYLQRWVGPIDSIYLACALAKLGIQLGLLVLLAGLITGHLKFWRFDFLLAAALVTPFFQTNGYRTYMGIIDPSTTYTFFYALPCLVLLIYVLPFFWQLFHGNTTLSASWLKVLWLPLSVVVCLSGPLNPGVILTAVLLMGVHHLRGNWPAPKENGFFYRLQSLVNAVPGYWWTFLLPLSLLAGYSLWLGSYNSLSIANQIPLVELYAKLPEGVYYQFTQKLGFPVLLVALGINVWLISTKGKGPERKKVLALFRWIGLFSLCYLLLLPLGGYRGYRPFVLRYDTIMPITLSWFLLYGVSSSYLLNQLRQRSLWLYLGLLLAVVAIFTFADEAEFDNNLCERSALAAIAISPESVVKLKEDCPVLDWKTIRSAERSKDNARLLTIWGITERDKLYYHP
ncbi:MAG: hypothetical protein AAGA31_06020 [Bacteroidota bacterium]